MLTTDDFKRIKNDFCGNPRYLLHFLRLNTEYKEALFLSKKLGGCKYRGKDFGGGIVFQTYSLRSLVDSLNEALKQQQQP